MHSDIAPVAETAVRGHAHKPFSYGYIPPGDRETEMAEMEMDREAFLAAMVDLLSNRSECKRMEPREVYRRFQYSKCVA